MEIYVSKTNDLVSEIHAGLKKNLPCENCYQSGAPHIVHDVYNMYHQAVTACAMYYISEKYVILIPWVGLLQEYSQRIYQWDLDLKYRDATGSFSMLSLSLCLLFWDISRLFRFSVLFLIFRPKSLLFTSISWATYGSTRGTALGARWGGGRGGSLCG